MSLTDPENSPFSKDDVEKGGPYFWLPDNQDPEPATDTNDTSQAIDQT